MARRRRLVRVVAALLALPVVLFGAVLLALQVPQVRERVAAYLIGFANGAMEEKLVLEGVERLDPWGVRVRHVVMRDGYGRLIVDAYGVTSSIAILDLLRARVNLGSARVERARLELPWLLPDPPNKRPKPAEPGDDTPSGWRVDIHDASVGKTDLTLALPFGELFARASEVRGQYFWREHSRVIVYQGQVTASVDQQPALTLQVSDSDWRSDVGGQVLVSGTLAGSPFTARATLSGVDVSTPWPQGSLRLNAQKLRGDALALFDLSPDWLRAATDVSLRAYGDEQGLSVAARLTVRGKIMEAEGRWQADELTLQVRVPMLRAESVSGKLPRGSLGGRLQLSLGLSQTGRLRARFNGLTVADVLVPDGRLTGSIRRDLLRIDDLTVLGFEQNLHVHGAVPLRGGQASGHVRIQQLDLARLKVARGQQLRGVIDGELELAARPSGQLRVSGRLQARQLAVRQLAAREASAQLDGQGTFARPEGNAALKLTGLQVPQLPMHAVNAQLSLQGETLRAHLDGQGRELSCVLDVTGRRVKARGHLQGIGKLTRKKESLRVRVEAQGDTQQYQLGAQLLGERGQLTLRASKSRRELTGQLDAKDMQLRPLLAFLGFSEEQAELEGSAALRLPYRNGRALIEQASLQADLRGELPLGPLFAQLAPSMASLSGRLTARLRSEGPLTRPHAQLALHGQLQLPERDAKPEELGLLLTLEPERAQAQLTIEDLDGGLLSAHGLVPSPPREALRAVLQGGVPDFELKAALAPRRLDLMQGVFAYLASVYALDAPLRIGGGLRLRAREGELTGEADMRVTLFGDAIDEACLAGARTHIELNATLQERELQLRTVAHGDKGGQVEGTLTSSLTPKGQPLALQPARLSVSGKRVLLSTLPGLCGLDGGVADITLTSRELGSARPVVELEAQLSGVQTQGGPALDLTLRGGLDAGKLRAEALVNSESHQRARVELQLPVLVEHGLPVPTLDARASAHLTLRDLPVAPFLSVGDQLGRASGSISGQLIAKGPLRDPQLRGAVTLQRVSFSIASLAQPLRDVSGRIAIDARRIEVSDLTARDRNGKVTLRGVANLQPDLSGSVTAELTAQRFPIRRQGEVVGEVSTRAGFFGKLDHALDLRGEVRIREGRFWLTGESGEAVQTLDRHEEIRFVDGRGAAEQAREQREEAQRALEKRTGRARELTLRELVVRSDRDIWFMHQDFSVRLGVDLKLIDDGEDEKLVGEVGIRRGQLTLIGKPFQIERGAVRLTGDYPPDPELELKASFEPPSGPKLYVEVQGRASSPIVAFSGAASTAEEAVAIVSGLGTPQMGAEQRAQADARGFASNITAGLLSATARRRLGEWVPLISVHSDVTGTPRQARAGFDASKLIPSFLRPIARGAYVEGIVGNTRQKRSGAVGVGIRLEVALPHDFVSSMGYGPGPTWATDLSWVP